MKALRLKQKDIEQLIYSNSPQVSAATEGQLSIINEDTQEAVGFINFTFTPNKQNEALADNVVNKSSEYTEVKLYGDGGSRGNPGPAAAGWVLYDMNDNLIKEGGFYVGDHNTNNQAEYLSLKHGLSDALQLGAKKVQVYMDSMLVVNQMKGVYRVKNQDLLIIHQAVKALLPRLQEVTFTHVPRERNKEADRMVNETLDAAV